MFQDYTNLLGGYSRMLFNLKSNIFSDFDAGGREGIKHRNIKNSKGKKRKNWEKPIFKKERI